MKKEELNIENIIHYIIGNVRYKLYYSAFYFFIRTHIFEQITFRIQVMDKKCYYNGQCKLCGCETTALQMANKPCNKPCYPKMMNKKEWTNYKKVNNIII